MRSIGYNRNKNISSALSRIKDAGLITQCVYSVRKVLCNDDELSARQDATQR